MNKNELIIEKLNNPTLIKIATNLKNEGIVLQTTNYAYLKISDDFIHQLYPLIDKKENLQKPDYFSEKCHIGAHITIIYPEEERIIDNQDINIVHSFEVNKLIKAQIGNKEYYALMVNSPSLIFLRKKYTIKFKF